MNRVFFLAILFIYVSCTVNNAANDNETNNDVQVENADFDCGVIDDTTKTISHTYHILNNTDDTCHITRIMPGCGCTSVICENNIIPPKGKTTVDVEINIDGLYNNIYKEVSIYTSLSDAPIIASINAFKRMPQSMIKSQFPYKLGENLRLSAKHVILGYVQHGQKVSRRVNIINVSKKKVYLKTSFKGTVNKLISYYVPDELDAGEISVIIITYDATDVSNIWGEQSCEIVINENDSSEVIHASGIITEKIVRKRGEKPRITVTFPPETRMTDDVKTWCYTLTNSGKSKLWIKYIQCLQLWAKISISSEELSQNQSAKLCVTVPLAEVANNDYIDLGVSTNDPIEPYKLLRIPFYE